MKEHVISGLSETAGLISRFIHDEQNLQIVTDIARDIVTSLRQKGLIICCGNGGSCTDAMHFAEELTGKFRKDRRPLPALALQDPSFLTCVANDYGFADVFSRGVEAYGKKGDILIVLSTSGNSPNIVNAVTKATALGLKTIGLLGNQGGKLKDKCDHQLIIPANNSDRIQEIHGIILHLLIELIERELFPDNY
ncbi:MAG: SIS domain-containing protein [Candidatus Cloacimonetes bacterium]|nr:SIS domain-containing protein [Candidatus Cloacimonadota bacterium]